jgi:hypothetical protein
MIKSMELKDVKILSKYEQRKISGGFATTCGVVFFRDGAVVGGYYTPDGSNGGSNGLSKDDAIREMNAANNDMDFVGSGRTARYCCDSCPRYLS